MHILSVCRHAPPAALPLLASKCDRRRVLCKGMRQEFTAADGSRTDCLNAMHAVEVEFLEQWTEGRGQTYSYVGLIGLRQGIFLICREKLGKCRVHRLHDGGATAQWKPSVRRRSIDE